MSEVFSLANHALKLFGGIEECLIASLLLGQHDLHERLRGRTQPVPAGWGLNIKFEHSFGGKSRWRVRLQTGGLNICLPNNRVGVWVAPYTYRFSTTPPTVRTPVTGNAEGFAKFTRFETL